jgi:hypothetical protein
LPDPPDLLPPLELRLPPDDDRLPPELERAGDELRDLELDPALLFLDFDDFLSPLDFLVPSAFLFRLDFGGLLRFLSTCFASPLDRPLPLLRVDWLLPADFLSVLFSGALGL